jgi:hypothetical protein
MARRVAPIDNPLLAFIEEEERFLAAILGPGGFLEGLRKIASGSVSIAISAKRPLRALTTPAWRKAARELAQVLTDWNYDLLAKAFRSAAGEIPADARRAMNKRIGELAKENAGRRAVAAAKKLDKEVASGLRTLIGDASQRYAEKPSPKILRDLTKQVKDRIGLTTKQARAIAKWEKAALKGGVDPRAVAASVKKRTEAALEFRARAIAKRGVEEDVGWGRHHLWLEASDAGLLPEGTMKRWRDQGDDRVRPSHAAQTRQGPVPLEEPYPIQGVMHPPSRDHGCRCWEELVMPKEG